MQKKNVVAKGRNRQALGDIGKLVTIRGVDGKPQPQINYTVPLSVYLCLSFLSLLLFFFFLTCCSRILCAQLQANAQAAATENNKRPLCVNNLDGVVAGKRAAKAAQKKVVVKPKPEEVIEKSPDTKEEVKKDRLVNRKKTGEGSSRKKVQTLTSVLTARSKHACGVTAKPKEKITYIDAADKENELAAVEHVEDIYKFYKMIECEPIIVQSRNLWVVLMIMG